jgi:two-component system cell cycle response regulator
MSDPSPAAESSGALGRPHGHEAAAPGAAGDAETIRLLRAELVASAARITELEALVQEDDLTGLLNRRGLYLELGRVIDFGRRYGFAAGLVFVDLDSFKAVNDRYGHSVGDAVLVETAQRIRANIRSSDAAGRLGGDEFLVVLRQVDLAGLRAKADALQCALESRPAHVGDAAISIGASVGITLFEAADTADTAITRADRDMFRVKRARQSFRAG